MTKIPNEIAKWTGLAGIGAGLFVLAWQAAKAWFKACDAATEENRIVGGQAASKIINALDTKENRRIISNAVINQVVSNDNVDTQR